MALSVADAARLASLQAALDKLMTGQQVAKVQSAGRMVEYGKPDMPTLRAEIQALVDKSLTVSTAPARQRGGLRFRIR